MHDVDENVVILQPIRQLRAVLRSEIRKKGCAPHARAPLQQIF
jgi:hypothetical protein